MATLATGRNLPPPQSPFVDPKTGFLTNDGYQFLLGFFNQLAGATPTATIATVTATGLTQATAFQLSAQWNVVAPNPAGNGGVLLAALQPGQSQTVFNISPSSTIGVFPPPGAHINALATNGPFSLAAATLHTFYFTSTTQIQT